MSEAPALHQFVTFTACRQLFGLPVFSVRDVVAAEAITRIPLAPASIAGSLNLRGRVVTAIELRRRLLLQPAATKVPAVCVVTEQDGELYALIVDGVSEVIGLPADAIEPNPPTLPPLWAAFSAGICRLDGALLVVLDLERLLDVRADPHQGAV